MRLLVYDSGIYNDGSFRPFEKAWSRAVDILNQSLTHREKRRGLCLEKLTRKSTTPHVYYKWRKELLPQMIYIQEMQTTGRYRNDALSMHTRADTKAKNRDPCPPKDLKKMNNVIVLKCLTSVYTLFVEKLHERPHGAFPLNMWEVRKNQFKEHNVNIVRTEEVDECHRADKHGVFLHDYYCSFVQNEVHDQSFGDLIDEVMRHQMAKVASVSQRSDAISQVRLQFGFWRSKQKSVSFSFKFVKLSSEFKRMIRRVGKALEGKAREHYREAFGSEERTNLVTNNFRELLDLGDESWVWEFIDVSITHLGSTSRHCDYVS